MPGFAVQFALALALAPQQPSPDSQRSTSPADHAATPSIEAARLPSGAAIAIDGALDDAPWAAARPATRFTQTEPVEGKEASERTEVRIVIGDDALYVGARLYDREPGRIKAVLARRDVAVEADEFDLYLDSFHDHLTGVHFRVTPGGATLDGILASDAQTSEEDVSWDPVWQSATRIDSLGWTAELRVPLSQLRYNSSAQGEWGIQLYRKILRKGEEDWFSFVPKTEVNGINRYGHLTGLGLLRAQRRLELAPYVLARAAYAPTDIADPFRDGHDYNGAAGLDLKYGITSDLTLNATVNPDFGQVEVDPAVVNLTAFETSFAEKRPFFVEGADVFRFGGIRANNSFVFPDFFFSRRIGRQPQRVVTGDDVHFLDTPTETSIRAAAKMSGRTRSGWSVGVLDAVTSGESARYIDALGQRVTTSVEPLTNYFVGRVRKDLRGGNSTLGLIGTATNRDQGDPDLMALVRGSAYLLGLDFTNSWSNRVWSLDGSIGLSNVRGTPEALARTQRSSARYYQRPDARSFHFDPTRTSLTGYAGQIALYKNRGRHWQGGIVYQETGHAFEANDLGFQQDAAWRGVSTALGYYDRKVRRYFRRFSFDALQNHEWNLDGDRLYGAYGLIFNTQLHNFWTVQLRGDYTPANFDDRLTRGGPVAGVPSNGDTRVTINSDVRRTTRLTIGFSQLWTSAGEYQTSADLSLSVRPTPALRVSAGPSLAHNFTRAQYVTTVPDPAAVATYGARYVFAPLELTELSMETRLDWTFTPTLSLQLYLQPLISAGDFGALSELRVPRSYDFTVYGRDRGTATPTEAGTVVDPGDGGGSFTVPAQDFTVRSLRANAVLRWEWRPGSTLFAVWQQNRDNDITDGRFRFGRDVGSLFNGGASRNVFAVKASYWLSW